MSVHGLAGAAEVAVRPGCRRRTRSHRADIGARWPLSTEPAPARMPRGRCATAIPARPPASPWSRGPPPGGHIHPAGWRDGRGSPTGSLTGSQPPPSSSHIGPHNTWSESPSSLACHHPATQFTRLILKQVYQASHR